MEEQNKQFEFKMIMIPGIIYALLTLSNVLGFFRTLGWAVRFPGNAMTSVLTAFILIAGYLFIILQCFGKKSNGFYIGLIILVAYRCFSFIMGFFTNGYKVGKYSDYGYDYTYQFSLAALIPMLLFVVGSALTLVVVMMYEQGKYEQYKEKLTKLWFLPAVIVLVGQVWGLLYTLGHTWQMVYVYVSFSIVLEAVAMFFICAHYCKPDLFATTGTPVEYEYSNSTDINDAAFMQLVPHTLLCVFTLGIWYLIWIYRMTGFLNDVEDEPKRSQVNQLLLCLFIPGYVIFWSYKSGQRIDKIAEVYGQKSRMTIMGPLTLSFSPIIMQDKINEIIIEKRRRAGFINPVYEKPEGMVVADIETGFRSLVPHTLLYVFTFGIYYLVWIYKSTEYLNRVKGAPNRSGLNQMLLCLFIPGYVFFWSYKSGQLIDEMATEYEQKSYMTIFGPLGSFLSPILMQDKINEVIIKVRKNKPEANVEAVVENETVIEKEPAAEETSTVTEEDAEKSIEE